MWKDQNMLGRGPNVKRKYKRLVLEIWNELQKVKGQVSHVHRVAKLFFSTPMEKKKKAETHKCRSATRQVLLEIWSLKDSVPFRLVTP